MLQRRSISRAGIDTMRKFTLASNEILYDVERMMSDDEYIPKDVRQAYQELKDGGMELFILKGMSFSYGIEIYRYTGMSRTRVLALLRTSTSEKKQFENLHGVIQRLVVWYDFCGTSHSVYTKIH